MARQVRRGFKRLECDRFRLDHPESDHILKPNLLKRYWVIVTQERVAPGASGQSTLSGQSTIGRIRTRFPADHNKFKMASPVSSNLGRIALKYILASRQNSQLDEKLKSRRE
jgi:hypothetical protein